MSALSRVLLLLCWVCCWGGTCSRTVDVLEAVVRDPPSTGTTTGDLWGYSAALHHTGDPYTPGQFSAKIDGANILIGGPRGNTIGAMRPNTGYVFVCPLNTATACVPGPGLLYDITGNDIIGGVGGDTPFSEEKEDQLMGFSMRSRHGSVVVCAPGWKHRERSVRYRHGRCVTVTPDLRTVSSVVEPCTLDGRNMMNNLLVDDLSQNAFRQCYAGIDVDLPLNGTVTAMGAPGAYFFTGTATLRVGDQIAVSGLPETPPLDDTSYTGMAMGRGRITDLYRDNLIVGSPRASNLKGQVRVIPADIDVSGRAYTLRNPLVVVPGDVVGAQFGLSVAAADLTGDGYDELLVGAPFHFVSAQRSELGAVHIFNNTGGMISAGNKVILEGGAVSGRFGFSITAMGDLDDDGYDEVAISAPGFGTVFIYSGRGAAILTPVLSQTITGESLNLLPTAVSGLTSFGSFLDGGTDIDGNYYNDLVIGAFESRKVFVVRSRTVATVATSITASRPTLPNGVTNFTVTFCMTFTGKGFAAGQSLDLAYTVYSDRRPDNQISRTLFTSTPLDSMSGEVTVVVNSSLNSSVNCRTAQISVKNSSVDIQSTPILPTVVAMVKGSSSQPAATDGSLFTTDLITERIYGREHNSSTRVMGERNCGLDDICHFDISVESVEISSPENATAFLGFTRTVNVTVTVRSAGPEDAYSPRVNLTFPFAGLGYLGGPCTEIAESYAVCLLGAVLAPGAETSLTISLNMATDTQAQSPTEMVVVTATLADPISSSDNETNSANNQGSTTLTILAATDAAVIVPDAIQSYTRRESPRPAGGLPSSLQQLGRSVNVSYVVVNAGPNTIAAGNITIQVPYRSACTVNSFLFYTVDVQVSPSIACTSSPLLDVLGLDGGAGSPSPASLPTVPGQCNSGELQSLHCNSEGVQCQTFQCPVRQNFARSAEYTVNLIGYIDDHHYSTAEFGTVLALSTSFSILSDNVVEGKPSNDRGTVIVEIRVPPITQAPPNPVEVWMIIVPIVIAILLIIGLFVILYVCGFFKRKRPNQDDGNHGDESNPEGEPGNQGDERKQEGEPGNQGDEPKQEGEEGNHGNGGDVEFATAAGSATNL